MTPVQKNSKRILRYMRDHDYVGTRMIAPEELKQAVKMPDALFNEVIDYLLLEHKIGGSASNWNLVDRGIAEADADREKPGTTRKILTKLGDWIGPALVGGGVTLLVQYLGNLWFGRCP